MATTPRAARRPGRPSKLSASAWRVVVHRVLDGESLRQIAQEYGVSPAAVSEHIGPEVRAVRRVVNLLLAVDEALAGLTPAERMAARKLAAEILAERRVSRLMDGAGLPGDALTAP